jgi:hypothetical protein
MLPAAPRPYLPQGFTSPAVRFRAESLNEANATSRENLAGETTDRYPARQLKHSAPPTHPLTRQVKRSVTEIKPCVMVGQDLQVELHVFHVGELHQQARRAAAAVLEVDLLQAFGREVPLLLWRP